jgi:hypothetical protein
MLAAVKSLDEVVSIVPNGRIEASWLLDTSTCGTLALEYILLTVHVECSILLTILVI